MNRKRRPAAAVVVLVSLLVGVKMKQTVQVNVTGVMINVTADSR